MVTMNAATLVTATFDPVKYSLIVVKSGSGTGTVTSSPTGINCGTDCSENYAPGTSVTLTATATTGSSFAGWSGGGCSGTASTCTVTMNAATNVTATFDLVKYSLIVVKSGSGTGTVTSSPTGINCGTDCSENYAPSTSVTLIATATTESSFAGWSGGGCSGTASTCTVTMNAATNVTVTFEPIIYYSLVVAKFGAGTGTVTSSPAGIDCGTDCSENYTSNTNVMLTATAATGSSFAGWSGGGCSGTASTCTVTMNAATTVTATFEPVIYYSLTVNKTGTGAGIVTSSPTGINCGTDCNENYELNTRVTLTATAPTGSTFAGWSGGCSGTTSTCAVTMSTAKTVTAIFNLKKYALIVVKSGNGSGTITSSPTGINCGTDCNESYVFNTSVTLTATAATGSNFAGWSGGGCSGTASTCAVTMSAAKTVTATFNLKKYALIVVKSGNGTGTITSSPTGINCGTDCSENYVFNTSVTLTATAATGSTFAGWSGGSCSGTASTCAVTMSAAKTVTATFNPPMYLLNVIKSGNGTISSTPTGINCGTDCSENYAPGTSVTLKATPGAGSVFTNWSGGCSGTSVSCVVTMNAATTVATTFQARPPATPVISAVAGNAQVTLKWSAVAGATSYQVFQGLTAGGELFDPVKTCTGTSVVITGLTNDTTYFFKMVAINASGRSASSNEVKATPRTTPIDFVITNLSWRPVNLNTGYFDVLVTVANQGYDEALSVYLDVWANQPTVPGCDVEGDASKKIGALAAGESKEFTLQVKANTTGGKKTLRAFIDRSCLITEPNETNNQRTRTYTVAPTTAPTIISVVKGNGQVTLKWTAVTGATSYSIFQGTVTGGEPSTPVKSATGTSVVISELTNGTKYFFNMAAVNAGGTGPLSNEVSATPTP
ncbi:hypothetical protein CCP3SC5AM1_2450001 [Gammaproteobacteria bacterium]